MRQRPRSLRKRKLTVCARVGTKRKATENLERKGRGQVSSIAHHGRDVRCFACVLPTVVLQANSTNCWPSTIRASSLTNYCLSG